MSDEDISLVLTNRYGVEITPLRDAKVSEITWELVEPGTASISISPLSEDAMAIELVRTEIQIWFGRVLRWWGVPWSFSGSSDSSEIVFLCEGILSYLKKRYIDRMSLDYDSIDQLAIGWDLISYAQDESVQANRDLNISGGTFTASGIPRSPRYERYEHKNILDALREYPGMSNGFEYEIVLSPDGTQRFWTPYFPQKGSFKSEYAFQWSVDGSRYVKSFTYTEDAGPLLTNPYVTGGSEGEVRFEANYEDVAASAKYGVMQEVISEGGQKDVNWLHDRAVRETELRREPIKTVEIHSVTTEESLLGVVVEGDTVPVEIDYGRVQYQGTKRIESVKWNPDRTLTYSFVEEVA